MLNDTTLKIAASAANKQQPFINTWIILIIQTWLNLKY